MTTKEYLAKDVIDHIEKHIFDNNKIVSTLERKLSDGSQFHVKSEFKEPVEITNTFLGKYEKELITKLSQIEDKNSWVIVMSFSIYGGKKPNDLTLIAAYNEDIGFQIIYKIESDHSFYYSE